MMSSQRAGQASGSPLRARGLVRRGQSPKLSHPTPTL
jgi:hypothetical protein